MTLAIGVDVGGTKVAGGVVDADGRILAKLKRSTPAASPPQTEQAIADVVTELLAGHEVGAIGLGAAGFVDAARATMLFAPNLAWRDEPLKQRVEERIGREVVVENDANASAWAESRFGAARGYSEVMLVAVGTGIGAAIIINGQLYRGRWGIAGEPGHMRVMPDGRLCGCGNRGCWEQYCSGSALVAEAREFARRRPEGAIRLLQLGGGTPEGIRGSQITQAASEGDPAALRCFQTVGGWLGQGLADLTAILDPACFVIGGGVSEAGNLLLDPARAAFERALTGRGHRPYTEIRVAELGPDAGLVGAADLARQTMLAGRLPTGAGRLRAVGSTADRFRSQWDRLRTGRDRSKHVVGLPPEPQTTAPSSLSSLPDDGSESLSRKTSSATPPTNAAIAQKTAMPGIDQPAAVAISR